MRYKNKPFVSETESMTLTINRNILGNHWILSPEKKTGGVVGCLIDIKSQVSFNLDRIVPGIYRTCYRRAANPPKVLYLRSLIHPHPPTHIVCKAHLTAKFLSFRISLVVVMNCRQEMRYIALK